jgi:hypothetical protein
VAGVKRLNLKIHPPPDLAIEVDVTRSALNRFDIYRTLGIRELWRLNGDDLSFHVLGADQKYTEVRTSVAFPGITPMDLMVFIKQARGAVDQNMPAAAFRAWLKHRLAVEPATPTPSLPPLP